MKQPDFEKINPLMDRCLKNAEDLLISAKEIQGKNRNNIAYHLAALALEEIGKASMIFADALPRAADDDDEEDDSRLATDAEDHKKQLFYGLFMPSLGSGVISPAEFMRLKEIAHEIHTARLSTLYVNVVEPETQSDISDEGLARLIGLTESRLNMERLIDLKMPPPEHQKEIEWFMKSFANPEVFSVAFSEQGRSKYAEFSGKPHQWLLWLHEQLNELERQSKELMEKEMKRLEPTGVLGNKPKWRMKIKFVSLSNSIKNGQLKKWNQQVEWIKLSPGAKPNELLADFILPAKFPIESLWQVGLHFAGMFAMALSVVTTGYFWWYAPELTSQYFVSLHDLENNATVKMEPKQPSIFQWQRSTLKAKQLDQIGLLFAIALRGNQGQLEAYGSYCRGLVNLAKTDLLTNQSPAALVEFARAFKSAMLSCGDWDANPDSFESSVAKVMGEMWTKEGMAEEFHTLIHAADSMVERKTPSRPITFEEATKLKVFRDAYFVLLARRYAADPKNRPQQGQTVKPEAPEPDNAAA
jgi:AbiV family abortive infection protein